MRDHFNDSRSRTKRETTLALCLFPPRHLTHALKVNHHVRFKHRDRDCEYYLSRPLWPPSITKALLALARRRSERLAITSRHPGDSIHLRSEGPDGKARSRNELMMATREMPFPGLSQDQRLSRDARKHAAKIVSGVLRSTCRGNTNARDVVVNASQCDNRKVEAASGWRWWWWSLESRQALRLHTSLAFRIELPIRIRASGYNVPRAGMRGAYFPSPIRLW